MAELTQESNHGHGGIARRFHSPAGDWDTLRPLLRVLVDQAAEETDNRITALDVQALRTVPRHDRLPRIRAAQRLRSCPAETVAAGLRDSGIMER